MAAYREKPRKPREVQAAKWDGSDEALDAIFALGLSVVTQDPLFPGAPDIGVSIDGKHYTTVDLDSWVAVNPPSLYIMSERAFRERYEPVEED